jgi:hypothetical protein
MFLCGICCIQHQKLTPAQEAELKNTLTGFVHSTDTFLLH